MAAHPALLPELEGAIARGSAERRATRLEQITQLFLSGAEQLNDEQVALFDDVFGRLIDEIEERALAELSQALAPVANAPVEVVRRLAKHEDITVAGPVLRQSPRLAAADLIEIARTQVQSHLLAISGRSGIEPDVTDVLVRRGDRMVLRSLAGNAEARLSDTGYAALVQRANLDGILAEHVGRREDIPPALFHRLVVQATAVVQSRLLASAAPERQGVIKRVLAKVADEVGRAPRRDYRAALERVAALQQAKTLSEGTLLAFAKAGEFESTAATLAALCMVPIEVVDRLINGSKPDPILILCKAMRYPWPTVAAVLSLRISAGNPALDSAAQQFERLSLATAQRILHFWRARPAAEASA